MGKKENLETGMMVPSQPAEMVQADEKKAGIIARAKQEIEMLKRTAEHKKMKAQEKPKIGTEELRKASEILRKYKAGKAKLEDKIIKNEEFWKLRQWNYMEASANDFMPASAWLWSCIQSRYSDVMDSYPTCNFQPRQQDDKDEAKMLSAIVPIILEQNRYEETYSDIAWYTLKQGGSEQGIFWDASKHNGLGDISVRKIDFLNIFWEPGITDIQESPNVFTTELVSNELLEQQYPQCKGRLKSKSTVTIAKYLYDEKVDTSDKSVVVDWYYHTYVKGKKTLQYVKFVGDIVLYATENETKAEEKVVVDPETKIPLTIPVQPSMAETGLYEHGRYPFVTFPLYPMEGCLCGYGLTDIGRDTQLVIDKLNKAIVDNSVVGATPRYFIKDNGAVNEQEYADLSKPFIHVQGNIGEEDIRPVDGKELAPIYVNVLTQKIEELKYVTSNQDSNNGIAPSGVTAGSAISALQEAAGKNARSSNKAFHRAYREVCYQIVELIRQFYDIPRTFRINPDGMHEQFVQFSNAGLKPQKQETMGIATGLRLPEFDIDVTTEKANPYKKMEINELALNFYAQGFFNPQMTDQALACLDMMDFTRKEDIMSKIRANGTMQELMIKYQQLALELANRISPEMAEMVGQQILAMGGQPLPQGMGQPVELSGDTSEHPFNEKARAQARASTEAD